MLFVYAEPEDTKRHTSICQEYINGVSIAHSLLENARKVVDQRPLLQHYDTNSKVRKQLYPTVIVEVSSNKVFVV